MGCISCTVWYWIPRKSEESLRPQIPKQIASLSLSLPSLFSLQIRRREDPGWKILLQEKSSLVLSILRKCIRKESCKEMIYVWFAQQSYANLLLLLLTSLRISLFTMLKKLKYESPLSYQYLSHVFEGGGWWLRIYERMCHPFTISS